MLDMLLIHFLFVSAEPLVVKEETALSGLNSFRASSHEFQIHSDKSFWLNTVNAKATVVERATQNESSTRMPLGWALSQAILIQIAFPILNCQMLKLVFWCRTE